MEPGWPNFAQVGAKLDPRWPNSVQHGAQGGTNMAKLAKNKRGKQGPGDSEKLQGIVGDPDDSLRGSGRPFGLEEYQAS